MKFQSHPKHTQIRAYVMWDEIKQINEQNNQTGLYVWASLTDKSILALQSLMVAFPERKQMRNATEYHCTVIYSKSQPDRPKLEFPQDRRSEIRGVLTRFEAWQDHKDRTIVVARVASSTLNAYHRHFLNMGFASDFPDYRTHITVAKEVQNNTALHIWLESVNAQLAARPMEIITFHGALHGSALS